MGILELDGYMLVMTDADILDLEADTLLAFGRMLAYPPPEPGPWLTRCRERIAARNAEAAEQLDPFIAFLEGSTPGERNETYSRAFDLNALFHPYIGYHLFGETYKRSRFMVRLKGHYREHGFTPERELPDHLAVVLRFLPTCDHAEFWDELIRFGVVPTLGSMLGDEDALPDGVPGPSGSPSDVSSSAGPASMDVHSDDRSNGEASSPGPAGVGMRVGEGGTGVPRSTPSPKPQPRQFVGMGSGTAFCQTGCTKLKGVSEMETERSDEQREEEKQDSPYRAVLESLYLLMQDTS